MKSTVLVVDDDAHWVTFLIRTLRRGGFTVLTVNDGSEVADVLSNQHIDLMLLDLQMPGMNGFEVIRSLRQSLSPAPSIGERPKVVVVSGRNEDETAAFVRRLGADAYLTKPCMGEQLLATVRHVLSH